MAEAFVGGTEMKRTIAQMVQALGPGGFVKVGFMEGSMAGWDGPRPMKKKLTGSKKVKADAVVGHQTAAAQVAFWNEYGTTSNTVGMLAPGNVHIKPRPFFRTMIERKSKTWGKLVAAALKMSKYNKRQALQIAGLRIAEQLQESILEFSKHADNADSTVAGKGFNTPLIDSHNMMRAVEYHVEDGPRGFANQGA